MAETQQLFKLKIDDDSHPGFPVTGLHNESTVTEANAEKIAGEWYPQPFFQEQEDGRILLFRSEAEATEENNAIGTIEKI